MSEGEKLLDQLLRRSGARADNGGRMSCTDDDGRLRNSRKMATSDEDDQRPLKPRRPDCDMCPTAKRAAWRLELRDLDGVRLKLNLCDPCLEREKPGPRGTRVVEYLVKLEDG